MGQGLRIRLPMQATKVQFLVQGDPTCLRATRPVSHNYWASALELQQEKPLQGAARTWKLETTALTTTREKPACSNRDLPGKKKTQLLLLWVSFLPSVCKYKTPPGSAWPQPHTFVSCISAPIPHLHPLFSASFPATCCQDIVFRLETPAFIQTWPGGLRPT